MKPKLIVFDLDDTLYDCTSLMQSGCGPKHLAKIVPSPGVIEFLANFSGKKVLVTKESGHDQQKKIDLLGIRNHFDHIFICSNKEDKKDCFQQVLARYPEHEISVVGDRIDAEIRYGNELGLTTIQILGGKHQETKPKDELEKPDHQISQFTELNQFFRNVKTVILAAGKGTRFNSDKAKVLHQVADKPMIKHVLDSANSLGINNHVVVIGYQGEEVQKVISQEGINFAWQKEQLGTGHAVMMADSYLQNYYGDVLVLYGDVPSLRKETLQKLIVEHQHQKNAVTILTAELTDPKMYGRILKNEQGQVVAIREAKDATPKELEVKEINSGILVIENEFLLSALKLLKNNNQQNEYYLTDVVEIAFQEGNNVGTVVVEDEKEIKGVNSLEELQEMEIIFRERSNDNDGV